MTNKEIRPNNWAPELAELRNRTRLSQKMGGADKLSRQKSRGKLNARERLDGLVDSGSFREIGTLAGAAEYDAQGEMLDFTPANFIFGRADIDGRPIVATADDFTVRGGAADAAIVRKFIMAEQMAHELRLPLIRMIDGTGGGGSVKMLEDMGFTYVPYVPGWDHVVKNLETVPVVALALGPTAGLGAARAVASHYSIMVKGLSQIFTAGPAVVAALGEDQDKESLGGSHIHTRNGVIDDEVASEAEAFTRARQFLSFLPSYAGAPLTRTRCDDPVSRADDTLFSIVPRDKSKAYNMRRVVQAVADSGSVFEMGARWGRGAITALARFDGWPVAVLAGDPTSLGGSWTRGLAQRRLGQPAYRWRC